MLTMIDFHQRVGQNLRMLRLLSGYNQERIAEVLGISRSTYSAYETCKMVPGIYLLFQLATFYQISSEWILSQDLSPLISTS